MGKAEILEELPKLNAEERRQIFEHLCELQEADLLRSGAAPSQEERRLLDEALAQFERDGDAGVPWRDAIRAIRTSDDRP